MQSEPQAIGRRLVNGRPSETCLTIAVHENKTSEVFTLPFTSKPKKNKELRYAIRGR